MVARYTQPVFNAKDNSEKPIIIELSEKDRLECYYDNCQRMQESMETLYKTNSSDARTPL